MGALMRFGADGILEKPWMASAPPDPHPDSPPAEPSENPDRLTPADEPEAPAPVTLPADDGAAAE